MNRDAVLFAIGFAMLLAAGCEKPVSQKEYAEPADPAVGEEPGDPIEDIRISDPDTPKDLLTDSHLYATEDARKMVFAARNKTTGLFFVTLQIGGRFFSDVTIRRIDDSGVQIRLENGLATFPWTDVPKMYLKEWGYDPVNEIRMVHGKDGGGFRLVKSMAMEEKERLTALKTQVEIIDTRIEYTQSVAGEAQAFHTNLTAAFKGADRSLAKRRTDLVYEKLRESRTCASCAPPRASSGSIVSEEAVHDRVLAALQRRITHFEEELKIDRERRGQLVAAIGRSAG